MRHNNTNLKIIALAFAMFAFTGCASKLADAQHANGTVVRAFVDGELTPATNFYSDGTVTDKGRDDLKEVFDMTFDGYHAESHVMAFGGRYCASKPCFKGFESKFPPAADASLGVEDGDLVDFITRAKAEDVLDAVKANDDDFRATQTILRIVCKAGDDDCIQREKRDYRCGDNCLNRGGMSDTHAFVIGYYDVGATWELGDVRQYYIDQGVPEQYKLCVLRANCLRAPEQEREFARQAGFKLADTHEGVMPERKLPDNPRKASSHSQITANN